MYKPLMNHPAPQAANAGTSPERDATPPQPMEEEQAAADREEVPHNLEEALGGEAIKSECCPPSRAGGGVRARLHSADAKRRREELAEGHSGLGRPRGRGTSGLRGPCCPSSRHEAGARAAAHHPVAHHLGDGEEHGERNHPGRSGGRCSEGSRRTARSADAEEGNSGGGGGGAFREARRGDGPASPPHAAVRAICGPVRATKTV